MALAKPDLFLRPRPIWTDLGYVGSLVYKEEGKAQIAVCVPFAYESYEWERISSSVRKFYGKVPDTYTLNDLFHRVFVSEAGEVRLEKPCST